MSALIHSHCLSAGLMAERMGLGRQVRQAVDCRVRALGRWRAARRPEGAEIPLATRVVQLAETSRCITATTGRPGAMAMARARSGSQFDPELVASVIAVPAG